MISEAGVSRVIHVFMKRFAPVPEGGGAKLIKPRFILRGYTAQIFFIRQRRHVLCMHVY
jgi:hypothetical protein